MRAYYRTGLVALALGSGLSTGAFAQTQGRLIGWNDLGMHCMDADFSVFSLLPPYNTFHAQFIDASGKLVKSGSGYTVSYEAVADATGSINRSSLGKTNFWSNVNSLFGATLPVDMGLTGFLMPGSTRQPMRFDQPWNWWTGEGVPITPYDDQQRKNYYPMMQLVARNSSGTVLASTRIVLPVSDEMDCRTCHGSNTSAAAMPKAGWVNLAGSNADRDYKLNILRLHDEREASTLYSDKLALAGYKPTGLYDTATAGAAVLCAKCHASNALKGTGYSDVKQLTSAIHSKHAGVTDPVTNLTLDSANNRSACYRCHPGSATKCLRGVMGNAVAFDGSMQMQCQSCHGTMSAVGASTRQGWFDEPSCQNCHTGTAIRNSGQIRFTSVFDGNVRRTPADLTFATTPDTPAAGVSLYRFSTGHGGLQCEACHGSTHAEYASSHANDNVQSIAAQGHVGTIAECSTCHPSVPQTANGGPHGMHPVGQNWASGHADAVELNGSGSCQNCHGGDLRGTVLSRSFASRTLSTKYGTKALWRGFQVGCYACHNGPSSESANPNRPAAVQNLTLTASIGKATGIALKASDADGNALTLRIVSQPAHGTVALSGTSATYFPDAGYAGADVFTYAAWDGSIDSNLGTVSVTVK